jgi:hypothetical protein
VFFCSFYEDVPCYLLAFYDFTHMKDLIVFYKPAMFFF